MIWWPALMEDQWSCMQDGRVAMGNTSIRHRMTRTNERLARRNLAKGGPQLPKPQTVRANPDHNSNSNQYWLQQWEDKRDTLASHLLVPSDSSNFCEDKPSMTVTDDSEHTKVSRLLQGKSESVAIWMAVPEGGSTVCLLGWGTTKLPCSRNDVASWD